MVRQRSSYLSFKVIEAGILQGSILYNIYKVDLLIHMLIIQDIPVSSCDTPKEVLINVENHINELGLKTGE